MTLRSPDEIGWVLWTPTAPPKVVTQDRDGNTLERFMAYITAVPPVMLETLL